MRKIFFVFCLLLLSLPIQAATVSALGVRTDYTVTPVGTTNWVVLVQTLPHTVSQISVTDISGQTLEIGICDANAPANSEVRQFVIPAGGVALNITIPATQRISIRSITGTANAGENDLDVVF